MSTAADWLADEYRDLDQLATTLNELFGPLTVPPGTSITGGEAYHQNVYADSWPRPGLTIRRHHTTLVVRDDGIVNAWGRTRTDRGPTLTELKLKRQATAQQVINALTVWSPGCQHPGCTEPAICEPPLDDVPRWCPDHCGRCGEGAT